MQSSDPLGTRKYHHGKTGLSRIFYTLIYSRDGFLAAIRSEEAFRQLLVLHSILIVITFMLSISKVERTIMITVCLISLIVELLNSAIEAAVDRISLEKHPLSKNAKDMGSAAQTIAILLVFIVWVMIIFG